MSRLLLALLAVLHGVPRLAAQDTLIDNTYDPKTGTRIVVTALISQLPTSGYLPVRVSLRNGGKIDRTWSFQCTSTDTGWSGDGNELRSSFSAPCAAGQATNYEFLVPLVTAFQQVYSSSTKLELDVSGTALPGLSGSMETAYDQAWPSIYMSRDLFMKNAGLLDAAAQTHVGSVSSSGSGGSLRFAGQFDPGEMSDQWLAYSGYDHCILTDEDWRALSPGARSALLQWNRLGGSLLIHASDSSLDLAALGFDTEPGVQNSTRSWGVLRIEWIPSSGTLDPNTLVSLVTASRPSGKSNRLASLRSDFSSAWPLQSAFGSKTAHLIFFILILIAFGVLVGPVNLFVFAKSGQRQRLFITTPIISVGASLLLIVLILFQDGFGGRGARLVLMEVRPDSSENAAYLCQEQIARTGVLLGTGFTTSDSAYITPVLIDESRWARTTVSNNGGSGRYQVEPIENGLQLAGDWFQSRSEHGHFLETIRSTRGRIELLPGSVVPVITSTFDFPLETLVFIDPDGKAWRANDVQQGRNTELVEVSDAEIKPWINAEIHRFSGINRKRLEMTVDRPGHFIATSAEAPAVDTLAAISWKSTHAVLTGPVFLP